MFSMETFGKMMLIIGGAVMVIGLVILLAGRLGLGRLPGDIYIQRENLTFYFPLATMLIISLIITVLLNLFRR